VIKAIPSGIILAYRPIRVQGMTKYVGR
jgi:hypothetical protein